MLQVFLPHPFSLLPVNKETDICEKFSGTCTSAIFLIAELKNYSPYFIGDNNPLKGESIGSEQHKVQMYE